MLADVGASPPRCNISGTTCTSCWAGPFESDGGCEATAQDAGLVLNECTDSSNGIAEHYYCPRGTVLQHSSCASVPLELVPFGALVLLALPRRVS